MFLLHGLPRPYCYSHLIKTKMHLGWDFYIYGNSCSWSKFLRILAWYMTQAIFTKFDDLFHSEKRKFGNFPILLSAFLIFTTSSWNHKLVKGMYHNIAMIFFTNSWFHKEDYFNWPTLSPPKNFFFEFFFNDIFRRSQQIHRFAHIYWRNTRQKTSKSFKISGVKSIFCIALYFIPFLESSNFICALFFLAA